MKKNNLRGVNMKKIKLYVSLMCVFVLMVGSTITVNAADIVAMRSTYKGDTTTVKFIPKGDNVYYHVGGSLAWRTNNPGNLRADNDAIGTYINGNGRYAIFPSYEVGLKAMQKLIKRKWKNCTIEVMIKGDEKKDIDGYAPESDGNDTEAYISYLVRKTGMKRNTVINDMSSRQFKKYVETMIKHEGFRKGKVVYTDIIISPE